MKIEVYETEDLPESDQINLQINDVILDSESIESIKLNVEDSLKKFVGKFLDSKTADFSDDISSKKLGYGFLEDPNITLTHKIESIRNRIKHLAQEVQITKSKLEESDNIDLFEDIGLIRNQISFCKTKAEANNYTTNSHLGKVVSKLGLLQLTTEETKKGNDSNGTIEKELIYNLQQWPNNHTIDSRKLASIESLIRRCETVVGDSSKLAALKKENEIKNVMDLLKLVVSKATILDLNQLINLEPRLTDIQQRSAMALNSKTNSDLTDKVDKTSALLAKIQPSIGLLGKLHDVVNSVQLFDVYHKAAHEYHETLIQVQNRQSVILRALEFNQQRLKQAELQTQNDTSTFGLVCADIKSK